MFVWGSKKVISKFVLQAHDGVVEDVAWHLRHEYLFGSVGDDHHLLIWDLRSPSPTKPIQSVVAHQGEVSVSLSCSFEDSAKIHSTLFGFVLLPRNFFC